MLKRPDLMAAYRPKLAISKEKVNELFILINDMDTQKLKEFTISRNIQLNVEDSNTGDNLMHKVMNIINSKIKEFHKLNMIKFLYTNGVNPDEPNKENITPLHLACKYQYTSIVSYLVSLGVDINYQDNFGMTPFHYALQGNILLHEVKEVDNIILNENKTDVNKKEKLIEINKLLWELIKDSPFISSIKNTVDNSIFSDTSLELKCIELYKKIALQTTNLKMEDNNNILINGIKDIKSEIKKNIETAWGNFNAVDKDLEIHYRNENSFHLPNKKLSPLKNTNINHTVKERVSEVKKNIKKICKEYSYVENTQIDKKPFYKIYSDFFNNFEKDLFIKTHFHLNQPFGTSVPIPNPNPPPPTILLNENIYVLRNDDSLVYAWNDCMNFFLNDNSIDWADNIIIWEDSFFYGGSRDITIDHNMNLIRRIDSYDMDINKKIFHILSYKDETYDLSWFTPDFATDPRFTIDFPIEEEQICITLVYNIVFDISLEEMENNKGTYSPDGLSYYEKWRNLFTLKKKNWGSILYAMYCEYVCRSSDDNLTGTLKSTISVLSQILGTKEEDYNFVNLNVYITNAFKKFYISEYMTSGNPLDSITSASLYVLLSEESRLDNIDFMSFNDIINPLVTAYITTPNNNNLRTLIITVLEAINKMKYKPFKSDILQLLTFITNGMKDIQSFSFDVNEPDVMDRQYDSKYDRNEGSNINNIIDIMKDYMHYTLFSMIYHLIETSSDINNITFSDGSIDLFNNLGLDVDDIFDNVKALSINKLIEARFLGLYYKGLIPMFDFNEDYEAMGNNMTLYCGIQEGNTMKRIFLHNHDNIGFIGPIGNRSHYFDINDDLVSTVNNDGTEVLSLPLIGNYLRNSRPDFLTDDKRMNYYIYKEHKYRPPIKEIEKYNKIRNQNMFQKIYKTLLIDGYLGNNLNSLIDSNKLLSKVFLDIYPVMSVLVDFINNEYESQNKTPDKFKDIIDNLNKYNGYILLYTYLFKNQDFYSLPKFNYYELPSPNNISNFLYYDNPNENVDLSFDIRFQDVKPFIPHETVINEDKHVISIMTTLKIPDLYKNLLRGKYNVDNNSLVMSKKSKLPPSMKSILPEFYRFSLISLLVQTFETNKIDQLNDILDKIKIIRGNKSINNENVDLYFIAGKMIVELVKNIMKDYVDNTTRKILVETLNIRLEPMKINEELIVNISQFEFPFNNTNIDIIVDSDEYMMNLYQFSDEYTINNINCNAIENNIDKCLMFPNKFIIYPEEYANSELLNVKYELKVDDMLYVKLLEQSADPYVLDSNSMSAIFPVLKMHNHNVLEKLRSIDMISINEFSNIKPYDYLKSEYFAHISKLTNDKLLFSEWLSNFVCYHSFDVKNLILSNASYKNNIPNYLDTSFETAFYITNQYLSNYVLSKNNSDINDLVGWNLNLNTYFFMNKILPNKNIYSKNIHNFIDDIKENNECKIKKLKDYLDKISGDNIKQPIIDTINKYTENNVKISNILDNADKLTKQKIDNNNIFDKYNILVSNNGIIQRGTLIKLFDEMFKNDDLNDSFDLLTFKIIEIEKNIFSDEAFYLSSFKTLKTIRTFYEYTNELSTVYMTCGKYRNMNYVLNFVYESIKFLTLNFIIFPYEMLLRNMLNIYIYNKYPNINITQSNIKIDEILSRVHSSEDKNNLYVLNNIVLDKIVKSTSKIFKDKEEEQHYNIETTNDILENYISLLDINDDVFKKNMETINSYFDVFIQRTIMNWRIIIENTFKFNINNGRIIKSIYEIVKN
jgi:hypothetical protein